MNTAVHPLDLIYQGYSKISHLAPLAAHSAMSPGYGRCPSPMMIIKGVPEANEIDKAQLGHYLTQAGLPVDLIFFTYAVKYLPPGGRSPYPLEIIASRPCLLAELEAVAPKVIVTLGETAFDGLTAGELGAFAGALEGEWQSYRGYRWLPLTDLGTDPEAVRSGLGMILGGSNGGRGSDAGSSA